MKFIAPLWIQLPEHVSMLQLRGGEGRGRGGGEGSDPRGGGFLCFPFGGGRGYVGIEAMWADRVMVAGDQPGNEGVASIGEIGGFL